MEPKEARELLLKRMCEWGTEVNRVRAKMLSNTPTEMHRLLNMPHGVSWTGKEINKLAFTLWLVRTKRIRFGGGTANEEIVKREPKPPSE